MDSQEKDKFANFVDACFNDQKCSIEGEATSYTFAIPQEYKQYDYLLPTDESVQENVVSILKEVATQLGPDVDVGSTFSVQDSTQGHPFGDSFAIKTTGDGDCLLHALSLCMWGREDHHRQLRGLLSLTFSNSELNEKFEELFMVEEKQRDVDIGFAGAREDKLLREEYANAATAAFTVGTYLEGIHICCLSHILRRPIIVLDGDDGHRIASCADNNKSRESSNGQTMAGIYLPVLHSSRKCASRSPLVIAYTSLCSHHVTNDMSSAKNDDHLNDRDRSAHPPPEGDNNYPSFVGHFTAVVGCDSLRQGNESYEQVRSIPLVTIANNKKDLQSNDWSGCVFAPMRVRYGQLYTDDSSTRDKKLMNEKLLRKYMDIETPSSSGVEGRSRQNGITQLQVAIQSLNQLVESTENLYKSCSNHLLSSTSHYRRSLFLGRIIQDKEQEYRRLEDRLAELQVEIRKATRDKNDCDYNMSQVNQYERRYLREWEKCGDQGSKSPLRHQKPSSKTKHRHSSSTRISKFDRAESNESNETNSTMSTKSSKSPRQHREKHVKNEDWTNGSKYRDNEGRDQDVNCSDDNERRTYADLTYAEKRLRDIEERNLQRAMAESLKDIEDVPPGDGDKGNTSTSNYKSDLTPTSSVISPTIERTAYGTWRNDTSSGVTSRLHESEKTNAIDFHDRAPAYSPSAYAPSGVTTPERRYKSTLSSKMSPNSSSIHSHRTTSNSLSSPYSHLDTMQSSRSMSRATSRTTGKPAWNSSF